MKAEFPRIRQMGERSILIEFEPEINEDLLKKVLYFKEKIEIKYLKEKIEVINTYNSLLICYLYTIENLYSEVSALKELLEETNIGKKTPSKIFHIPVCYEADFALDLKEISSQKKLSPEEIVRLHTATFYTVYFIGFLPGFLYLGGLDERLQISRKKEPRMEVKKGSVGIGEKQTGIYPQTSPGGWQIIGNSPIQQFDKNNNPPCPISAGDKVKFYSVGKEEYLHISEMVNSGRFQLISEVYES